ncbi:hypothetical protein ASG89_33705 [Paenibacillus sp. Soil766]|nr:hypothetical protein ASG89_33705 [Paenibacillus sp. Soil766]
MKNQFPMYPTLLDSLTKGKILADPDVPFVSPKLNDIMELNIQSALRGAIQPKNALENMEKSFTEVISSTGIIKK